MKYSLYTDGSSCGRKKGPIGWGWVVISEIDGRREIVATGSGGAVEGTNNIAELMAAKEALRFWARFAKTLPPADSIHIELVSDSQYVLGLAKGEYSASKNVALAGIVRDACKKFNVMTRWVEGHAGEPVNEMCDRLAKMGKEKYRLPDKGGSSK